MGPPIAKLDCVITYLEMTHQPVAPTPPVPAGKHALLRAANPTVSYYRYLYETVGTPWLWYERRLVNDAALAKIIQDPLIEIFVFYVAGVPAGYSELDRREPPDIELAYFGLTPDFIGRGLGRYFLRWTVDQAWTYQPDRLWVHTCSFDHPRALGLYQKIGFTPYRQASTVIDDPRTMGILPLKD